MAPTLKTHKVGIFNVPERYSNDTLKWCLNGCAGKLRGPWGGKYNRS